jgi:hypothetical protein
MNSAYKVEEFDSLRILESETCMEHKISKGVCHVIGLVPPFFWSRELVVKTLRWSPLDSQTDTQNHARSYAIVMSPVCS